MTQWKEIQRNILVFTTPIYITVITQTTVLRFVIHVLCLWGHVEKNFSCNWAISNLSRDYDGKVQSIHFIFLTHIDQTNWSSLNRRYFYLWNCFDICILTRAVKLKGMASTIHPSKKNPDALASALDYHVFWDHGIYDLSAFIMCLVPTQSKYLRSHTLRMTSLTST